MSNRYALILGHNRPIEIADVITDIQPQVDTVLVIDNASDPPLDRVLDLALFDKVQILGDPEQPPNLSRLWNIGLKWIQAEAYRAFRPTGPDQWVAHKVAILTDDVRIPEGWFDAVEEAMDRTGATIGCSNGFSHVTKETLKRQPDSDLMNRMYSPAFVLRGEHLLRADETMRWWWGDTDLDFRARQHGGMVNIPGYTVVNRYPNASTVGVLAHQAALDGQTFTNKWGWRPW